ncbi:O-antigen ligase family protein [Jeotgalibaca caeni]|uniref:O-antigen ligase family protein n=1 Tax=Jeotgalibaca caeni TaxID=3028623 RepID=UPI00237E1D1C|nr:O-antigen ligase family protein [Jeotgalibaca caeni]MDE1548156.1 O-antigen ligase family protein [Jeotgalibaca caeni]
MKKLVYVLVFSVFLGTQILAIDIGFKLSLYRILFLFMLYLFGIQFLNNDSRLRFYPRKLSSTYTSFYFIWLLYSLMSIAWSESLTGWIRANIFIGIGVFSIVFIHLFVKEKKDVLRLFQSVVAGVTLHILLGLSELITGNYFWASDHFMTKYRPGSRNILTRIPISIYPNENDYATMLLMGSFFILFLFRHARNVYVKTAYLGLWLCCFWLIYQTDSRANLLAFFIGMGAMTLVYFAKVITQRGFFIALGGLTGAGAVLLVVSASLRGQVVAILQLIAGRVEFDGSSNHERVNLIKNGFYFLKNSFGFGVGAGNIEHYMKTKSILPTDGISNMHNWWMEILTGYGVLIFVIYLLVYISMIRKAYQYYRYSEDAFIRKASLSIIGYLAAFTLSSISSASNIINEWQWVVFGVIIAFFSYCESLGIQKKVVEAEKNIRRTSWIVTH